MGAKDLRSRGAAAAGALIIIATFIVALACLSAFLVEYNRYSQNVKATSEAVTVKGTECPRVTKIDRTAISVENQGSTPIVIVGLLKANPADKSVSYVRLPDPIVIPPLTAKQISLPQPIPSDWYVGVHTSTGNVFWERWFEEGGGGSGTLVPPGQMAFVIFDVEGIGSDALDANVLVVDGVTYKLSNLPKGFLWISGETHSFEWLTPVAGEQAEYNWNSTKGLSNKRAEESFLVDRNGFIMATYTAATSKYKLRISVVPSDGGFTNPPPGPHWYDPGSRVQISATPAQGWIFERWVGSGSGSYSGTSSSAAVTMNGWINETAYFYTFTVSASPNKIFVTPGGSVTATVTVALIGGYSSSITVNLSASGAPSGTSISFSPSSVAISTSSPSATSIMTISVPSSVQEGTYTVTIAGSGGGITKTALFTLRVVRWLMGWQYRKSHIIYPARGAGTDYQVKIKVYYESGLDICDSVYLGGKCRSDFGDVRFTRSDGMTQLSYWIQEKVDGSYAIFWVKIADDLSANPATIYIYYGNPSATTTSNISSTFIFGQDFRVEQNIDKWTVSGTLHSVWYSSTEGITIRPYYYSVGLISKDAIDFSAPRRVLAEFRLSGYDNWCSAGNSILRDDVNYVTVYAYYTYSREDDYLRRGVGLYFRTDSYGRGCGGDTEADPFAFHKHNIHIKVAQVGSLTWYLDNKLMYTNSPESLFDGPSIYIYLYVNGRAYRSAYLVQKYIAVGKFTSPEPSHGAWGVEESLQ